MAQSYAGADDIAALGIAVSDTQAANLLCEAASARLRLTAKQYGKDIDKMIADADIGEDYLTAVKDVVVQSVARALSSISAGAEAAAISQTSQSALGYSASMTYLNAGQSLYFLKSELKALGLLRQTWGAAEVYDVDSAD